MSMNIQAWGIVMGVVMSALFTLGPWMFMVHAKLAVIAARIVELGQKVEKATEANERLWSFYAQHEARLETHQVQIAQISERLREMLE